MSLDYYLQLKNKYEHLIFSIDQTIDIYKEMLDLAYKERIDNINSVPIVLNRDIAYLLKMIDVNKENKMNIINLKKKVSEFINQICEHDFIEDLIDIDPDRSKIINYCRFCGYTK